MKKFIIIMLGILTLSDCANLEGDYTYVDHGTVSSVNHKNNELTLHHEGKSDSVLWHLSSSVDDMSLFLLGYGRCMQVGDTAYVYQKGDILVASEIDVMQARKVKDYLSDYNLSQFFSFSNLLWIICWAIGVVLIVLGLCAKKGEFSIYQGIIIIVFAGWCIINLTSTTNPVSRLRYDCKGTIQSISGNMVRTTNNQGIFVNNLTDICRQTPLKKGMVVHFYRYSSLPSGGGNIIFASQEKLNRSTLKCNQAYPNSWMIALGFILAVWALMLYTGCNFWNDCLNWYDKRFLPQALNRNDEEND